MDRGHPAPTPAPPVTKSISVPEIRTLSVKIDAHCKALRESAVEMQRLFYVSCQNEPIKPLACYAESNFSQNGEDGIVAEIFRRLGQPCRTFIEIGAGDGTENNTIYLLLGGASGLWVEAGAKNCAAIREGHKAALAIRALALAEQKVSMENVNAIISGADLSRDLDLLSIDIDGNDYWVWKAVTVVAPKVVVMEYNARFGSSLSWTIEYNAAHTWPGGNSYFGASLKALEKLGREKDYVLVGTDFMGVNAFFVRKDLLADKFSGPYTAEALFQPFRRSLGAHPKGKAVQFGPYVNP